jgi:Flp pilus assembly protein TadB
VTRLRPSVVLVCVGAGYTVLALIDSGIAHSIITGYLVVAITVLLLAVFAQGETRRERRRTDLPHDQRPLATRGDFRRFERYVFAAIAVTVLGFVATGIGFSVTLHRSHANALATRHLAEQNQARLSDIDAEVKTRTKQFCDLQVKRVEDLDKQVRQTEAFLKSPAAANSGLTDAIKANLPRLVHAARRERAGTPPVCFRVVP